MESKRKKVFLHTAYFRIICNHTFLNLRIIEWMFNYEFYVEYLLVTVILLQILLPCNHLLNWDHI